MKIIFAITKILKPDTNFNIPCVRSQKRYLGGENPKWAGSYLKGDKWTSLCYADQFDSYKEAEKRAKKYIAKEQAEYDEYADKYEWEPFDCSEEVRIIEIDLHARYW